MVKGVFYRLSVSPAPNPYVEASIPSAMVFRGGALER